jgi:hypothetical protein
MGSRFLIGGASSLEALQDGTFDASLNSLTIPNKTLNQPAVFDDGVLTERLLLPDDLNFAVVSNPFRGTLQVDDLETLATFSLNGEIQKIDNFGESGDGLTNIDGTLNVDIIKVSEIYDPSDSSSLQFSNTSIGVLAANFNLNNNNITQVNDITSSRFIVQGGTDIEYLMADGSLLTQSANSGNSNFYLYHNVNNIIYPAPASGSVVYNHLDQESATVVYISHLTRDNIDIEIFFQNVSTLNILYLQDQDNSANFIRYDITGNATITTNSYISVPVSMIDFGGNGNESFGNNKDILVSVFTNTQETNTRLSSLETKTQNQSAIVGTTAFSGIISSYGLNMNSTKITNVETPTLSTDGVNKTYVDTNALLKTGGTMTGAINSLDILPATTTNTNKVGSSTYPYLSSESTTANTKTLTIWNSARTFNHSITSLATTANVPMTLPATQSFGLLQNNGFGTLYWSNVLSPMNVITSGSITGGSFITNGLISPAVDNTNDIGTAGKKFKDLYLSGNCNAASLTNGSASIGLSGSVATVATGTQFAYTNFPYCAMNINSTSSTAAGERLVTGSAVSTFSNQFSINTTTGVITYTGIRTIPVKISVNCSITAPAGIIVSMYMALNGGIGRVGNNSYLYQTSSGGFQSFVFTEVINMATNNTTQPAVYTVVSNTLNIWFLSIICEAIPV